MLIRLGTNITPKEMRNNQLIVETSELKFIKFGQDSSQDIIENFLQANAQMATFMYI